MGLADVANLAGKSMGANIIRVLALCLAAVLGFPTLAPAATEFLTYEGRDAVHEGQGGEKKIVGGVDFWMTGAPPRRFQVLGSITDRRHETGLIGMVRMSALDDDIAKAVKTAGGDAVILEGEDSDVVAVVGGSSTNVVGGGGYDSFHGNAFSSGFARQIKKHDSRRMVVRYLVDGVPAAANAVTPPAPAPPSGP
jgi:hypothetical protein